MPNPNEPRAEMLRRTREESLQRREAERAKRKELEEAAHEAALAEMTKTVKQTAPESTPPIN